MKNGDGMKKIGIAATAATAADLLCKRYAELYLSGEREIPVPGGKLLLTKYHNYGAALNLGEKQPKLVLAVSSGMLGAATAAALLRGKKGSGAEKAGFALLLAGAVSNVSDRVRKGYVVDYIGLPFPRNVIWNLGDFYILIGSVLLAAAAVKGK